MGVRVYMRGCRDVGVGCDVGVSGGAGEIEAPGVTVGVSVNVAVGAMGVDVNVGVTSELAGILKWDGMGELHANGPATVTASSNMMIKRRVRWERFPM